MRQIDGSKPFHTGLILTKKRAAGRKVIVNHVEDLSIYASNKAGQDDRIRTVIDISKGYGVGSAEMKKKPESADAHAACKLSIPGTVDAAGPDDDVRHAMLLTIFSNDLLLSYFSVAVRLASKFRLLVNWA